MKYRFNRYLLAAFVILLLSSTVTFLMLANGRTVRAASLLFNDVALDHPAYQLCRQLIEMGAVRPYPGMNLAPFEKISADDWNYALLRIGEELGRVIPESAQFASNQEISGEAIVSRVQQLLNDDNILPTKTGSNDSRLSAYFFLERYLLESND
ncbi:MAG: hypothetical protein A2W80_12705 [Candidatus Riflebacteria bacterium GWC2_50_8]|nr:MAG: hypothetical protein A2W80_12705 [Candidatus Riflebacteria bacterium GWC2_50_8]